MLHVSAVEKQCGYGSDAQESRSGPGNIENTIRNRYLPRNMFYGRYLRQVQKSIELCQDQKRSSVGIYMYGEQPSAVVHTGAEPLSAVVRGRGSPEAVLRNGCRYIYM